MRKRSINRHEQLEGPNSTSDPLERYRRKRDPASTVEPFPTRPIQGDSSPTRAGRFVIHLHHATRVHYDLRLQVGPVLKSFAVPKGPSLDPSEKRLAVMTEDHPLGYLEFEDVIPRGNYGAGPMIVWDYGRVRYLGEPAEAGLEHGKIDFELQGFKIRGRFGLVETRGGAQSGSSGQRQWLLIKKEDEFVRRAYDPTASEPLSVLSGLSIEQLAVRDEVAAALEELAATMGAPLGELDTKGMTPMLCAMGGVPLDDPQRIYELKLDGVRVIAELRDGSALLRSRNGGNVTASYPELARAVRALAPRTVVLDGEIVAFDELGRPDFQRLATRIHLTRPRDIEQVAAHVPVVFMVFDLLQLGGRTLVGLPLRSRKELLQRLLPSKGLLRVLDHLEADGERLLSFCVEKRLEGIVAKRADSPYCPGPRRTQHWVKVKCQRDDDFVIVGWAEGKGARSRLGAILLASYEGERLVLRGKAGSGLSGRSVDELLELLTPLQLPNARAARSIHRVRPELVASIQYTGWTDDGQLRHPVFRGLRADIDPKQCTAGPAKDSTPADDTPQPVEAPELTRVQVTKRAKLFWPKEGITKGALCEYYASIGPALLPFLKDRPVVLVRYPDGIEGKSFYQWRVPAGTPSWVRTATFVDPSEGARKSVFLIDSVDALVHVANLGCIPIHVLASRMTSIETCDFLTIDFDLGPAPLRNAVIVARTLHALLERMGLEGFPKTSGQSGIHVLVPLGLSSSFETARLLADLLGKLIESQHPDLATTERRINRRAGRVYIDTGQTGPGRTIVAPYSVRARPGATVSTPLRWDEVHVALDPSAFTIDTVPERLRDEGDPMASMLDARPDVAAAILELEAIVSGRP